MATANVGRLVASLFLDDTQFERELESAERRVFSAGRRLEAAGARLTRNLSLPIAGAGAISAKFAADFEASMTKVNTLVGVSQQEVDGLSDAVLALSGDVGRGPRELADAMFFITSASLRGRQAVEALEVSAKLAAIGLGDTATVADAVTSAMNAYGHANLSAARAANVLLAAVAEGKIEADALAGSIGRVLGIAADMGVEFEQVAAFVATFTRVGVDAEQAVTSFRAILNNFVKATPQVEQALLDMGTSLDEVRRKIDEDFVGTLLELNKKIEGSKDRLGELFPNVRAVAGFLGTAASQGEAFSKVLESIAGAEGADRLNEAFAETQKTSKFLFDQLLSNSERLAIRLGRLILPAANVLIARLTSMLERTEQLSVSSVQWAIGIGAALAFAGPLLWSLGQILQVAVKIRAVLLPIVSIPLAIKAGVVTAVGLVIAMLTDTEDSLIRFVSQIPIVGTAFARATSFATQKFNEFFAFVTEGFANMLQRWAEGIFRFAQRLQATGYFQGVADRIFDLGRSLSDLSGSIALAASKADEAAIAEEAYRAALAADAEVEAERTAKLGDYADAVGKAIANVEKLKDVVTDAGKLDLIPDEERTKLGQIANAFDQLTRRALELRGQGAALFELDLGKQLADIQRLARDSGASADAIAEMLRSYDAFARQVQSDTAIEKIADRFRELTRAALELEGALGREGLFRLELEEDLREMLDELRTVEGLTNDQIDTILRQYEQLAVGIEERTRAISVNIGDTLADSFSEGITGVLRGTREFDFFAILKDVAITSFSDMFSEMLRRKLSFEVSLGDNFGTTIPNMMKAGAEKGVSLWNAALAGLQTGLGALGGLFGFSFGAPAAAPLAVGPGVAVAAGGVTTGPTAALIGDNPTGRELVLPLERASEFAAMVAAQQQGGSGGETIVNVYSNLPTRTERRQQGTREIVDVFVGEAKKDVARDILNDGVVGQAVAARFGLGGPGALA